MSKCWRYRHWAVEGRARRLAALLRYNFYCKGSVKGGVLPITAKKPGCFRIRACVSAVVLVYGVTVIVLVPRVVVSPVESVAMAVTVWVPVENVAALKYADQPAFG